MATSCSKPKCGTGTTEQSFNSDNNLEKQPYALFEETAQFILSKIPCKPLVGIICGSGLSSIGEAIDNPIEFPYEQIPHFPVSTVKEHVSKLIFGYISNIPVICMRGRFHYYEGYPLWRCAMPVRVMKLIGVTYLIVSNAAGGVNEDYEVGDIMLMKDHINLVGFAGNNPLQGPNEERFGPRFLPMNKAYNKNLLAIGHQVANEMGIGNIVHEGVYTCIGGPSFETVAELKMLKLLGANAVGMSTVHEVVIATHCGLQVFAFSLISNKCIMEYESDAIPEIDEIMNAGNVQKDILKRFIQGVIKKMADNHNTVQK